MSVDNYNGQPTDYENPVPNSEVRLSYYVYTWNKETNKQQQRAGWSSIGSYYLSDDKTVIYGSNQNQLIKSAGSAGVNIVDNTLGIIANVNAKNGASTTDVAPIILYVDGTYIAGLDNNTIRCNFDQHTTLNTIDLHYIESNNLNDHSITYTNLYEKSSEKSYIGDQSQWVSIVKSDRGTIQENTFIPLIGESSGINKVTNTGFIYNNLKYNRPYNPNLSWRNFVNYVGNWTYASNGFDINIDSSTGNLSIKSKELTTKIITPVTDKDVLEFGIFKQEFQQIHSSIGKVLTATTTPTAGSIQDKYGTAILNLGNIQDQIDILLGNTYDSNNNKNPVVSQAAITSSIFNLVSNTLAIYSSVSNVGDVWVSAHSAISVEKIPWNSTFIDINTTSTATGFVVANDRTKTWQYTQFPTIDETWEKIRDWTVTNENARKNLINRYPITATSSTITYIDKVWYTGENNTAPSATYNIASDKITLWGADANSTPTSFSYYINNNENSNIFNSANRYRFLGMTTKPDNYSNSEGSNIISITGFNKILLEDLYENPNNYQIPKVKWYWIDDKSTSHSTDNAVNVNVNTGISYALSITSALNSDTNFIVAGVGSTNNGKSQRIGYNGVFYIPLPSSINTDEDGKYEDTHWMLTTYTPQINKGADGTGIHNSGSLLYKYTKMSNLITTGVFGGFTPYHAADSITANLVNIPQVSYSEEALKINGKTVVSAEQNQAAKINKLISNIAYIVPANGENSTPSEEDASWYRQFTNQITSDSNKCTIITLNNYEADIIKNYKIDTNATGDGTTLANHPIANAMYLDLFGYKDEEWNNLSFDVNRKYIFTFNCHIQATNLQLTSEQINYGTPSLLLLGHFRQRYAKATNTITNFNYQAYPGETMLIPLLNKPLENAVNNIYNIEGTYTLSWDTTGTNAKKAIPQSYSFYIQDKYNDVSIPTNSAANTISNIYTSVYKSIYFENAAIQGVASNIPSVTIGIPNTTKPTDGEATYPYASYKSNNKDVYPLNGNRVKWMNVMDRIYAFILVGPNVNPNLSYQFVNINTYQDENRQILSPDDIALFAGMNDVYKEGAPADGGKGDGTTTITTVKINTNVNPKKKTTTITKIRPKDVDEIDPSLEKITAISDGGNATTTLTRSYQAGDFVNATISINDDKTTTTIIRTRTSQAGDMKDDTIKISGGNTIITRPTQAGDIAGTITNVVENGDTTIERTRKSQAGDTVGATIKISGGETTITRTSHAGDIAGTITEVKDGNTTIIRPTQTGDAIGDISGGKITKVKDGNTTIIRPTQTDDVDGAIISISGGNTTIIRPTQAGDMKDDTIKISGGNTIITRPTQTYDIAGTITKISGGETTIKRTRSYNAGDIAGKITEIKGGETTIERTRKSQAGETVGAIIKVEDGKTTTTTTTEGNANDTDKDSKTIVIETKNDKNKEVIITKTLNMKNIGSPAATLGIDSGILGVCEPMFSMTIQRY